MQLEKLVNLDSYEFAGMGKKTAGKEGIKKLYETMDRKSVIIVNENGTRLVYFPTKIGIPAFYPLSEIAVPKKISAVLMDLDGTSVKSEHFWIWVIQSVIGTLKNDMSFKLKDEDAPFVSGYSVSEHLQYGINKYCAGIKTATLEKAREVYFEIVHRELQNVLDGKPVVEPSFEPAPYLKELLLYLKERNIKIGLVSSGLYEKSIPEIKAAFDKINMGDPITFYDAIITAGFGIKKGYVGTLGELEPKPHPWLYAEALHGLNVPKEEVIGIEDSGAGILSLVSAGIAAFGLAGGNIESGGELPLCTEFFNDLGGVLAWIKNK